METSFGAFEPVESAASGAGVPVAWLDMLSQSNGSLWWLTDRDGLVAGEHALAAFTGLATERLQGGGWLDAVASDDRAVVQRAWQNAVYTNTAVTTACRMLRAGRRPVWLTIRVQPDPQRRHWLWVASHTTHERAVRSMSYYRSLFDQAAQGVMLIGATGAPVRVNAAALRMLGLERDQLHGKAPLPSGWQVSSSDGIVLDMPFRRAFAATADGQAAQMYWEVRADGWPVSRWLSVACSPVMRAHPESRARTLVFLTDLTERVHNHLAMKTEAQQASGDLAALHAALDRMTDAFVVLDYEGRFTYVNARAQTQFAPDGDALIGKRFWEAFPNLEGAEPHTEFDRAVAEQTPRTFETQFASGAWYQFRSYPAADGISVYIRDITIEKRMLNELDQALLRASQARAVAEARAQQLVAVFEAVGDGMVTFGHDGAALQVNPAMRVLMRLIGEGEPLPDSLDGFIAALDRHERPRPSPAPVMAQSPLRRIFSGESLTGAQAVDLWLSKPDGRDLYFNVSGAPVRGVNGEVIGAVVSLRDVTAEREAEQDRSRTLSLVAHELRTPLTAIKLSMDVSIRRLKRNMAIEPSTLDLAVSSCLQLERMVSDLVDAARAEREKIDIEYVTCNALDLAAQALAEHKAATSSSVFDFEAPRAPLEIRADPIRIRQVYSNLLSNAIKYSPVGSTVGLRIELRHGCVWSGVTDEGPGVPPDAAPHLFEAFYRAPDATSLSGQHAGLGLGLFLCKRIVDLHGGHIGVAPRPEGGSLFWFTVPLARAED